jgi:type IV secretion system protein VirB11
VTAAFTSQRIDRRSPLLSAMIPIDLSKGLDDTLRGGYRVQVVRSPAVPEQTLALCIRKPSLLDLSLAHYQERGAFDRVNAAHLEHSDEMSDSMLQKLVREKNWFGFLQLAVKMHKNIMISAGTNAGKTTFANAMLKLIPMEERIITIEDARELLPPQPNSLHLLFSRGEQGEAAVSAVELLEASLRLTGDRLIMGELRGAEAYTYLEMLNTGTGGSISTIHANSPALMYERLSMMVMRAGIALNQSQIIDYARSLIQVVVQFKFDQRTGERYVSEILYEGR